MTRRHIHYESAFREFLRTSSVPYVAVDEAKRSIFGRAKIKSFDLIVYAPSGANLLVDVKGRKFPYTGRAGRRYWENWVTSEDIEGLSRWQQVFGEGFDGMFVFAYWLVGSVDTIPVEDPFEFRGELYWFIGLGLDDYRAGMRVRSPKWRTVALPRSEFRRLMRPMSSILTPASRRAD